ncbi:MAG: dihydroorotase [Lachnospiraceae bacterium]|nr:dihydroorotase [Lachnospiraceae bacterium]
MKLIIKNGRVLNPATKQDAVMDVMIENSKILQVGSDHASTTEETDEQVQVIDASGCFVMPGFVDLHVHFRDPGLTYKEDIATGARAAARGGVTTVCAMPNTKPVVDCVETLDYIQKKAAETAPIHVEQLSAITVGQNGTELVDMKAMTEKGAIAFSEDGKSVMDILLYAEAMKQAAELGAVVMAHCEDKALVRGGVLNEGVASEKFGVPGITNSVEDVITARDIFLANDYGTKLHLCHCSTAGSVELVRMAKNMGIPVTAEVCPHHFTLTDGDIDKEDANYKMNPPLRSEKDVQALIKGLQDGTMEVISTDHAPHSAEEKAKGFLESPFGIVGLETSASLTYTALVATGILTPMQMAEKMSWNPAKVIGIDGERGSIEAGKLADLVIFDPDAEYTVDVNEFASKGRNTPYNGKQLMGRVRMTICEGKIVYQL